MHRAIGVDAVELIDGSGRNAMADYRTIVAIDCDLDVIDIGTDALFPIIGIGATVDGNDAECAAGDAAAERQGPRGAEVIPTVQALLIP